MVKLELPIPNEIAIKAVEMAVAWGRIKEWNTAEALDILQSEIADHFLKVPSEHFDLGYPAQNPWLNASLNIAGDQREFRVPRMGNRMLDLSNVEELRAGLAEMERRHAVAAPLIAQVDENVGKKLRQIYDTEEENLKAAIAHVEERQQAAEEAAKKREQDRRRAEELENQRRRERALEQRRKNTFKIDKRLKEI